MTRDEAVSLMAIQLGFRTDQATNLVTVLKAAQVTLERAPTKPWFLLSERAYINTVANEPRVKLPTTFLLEHEENGLTYIPTGEDPVPLVKETLDQLKVIYKANEGAPEAYALDGNYFRLFPIPDAAYVIEMYFYQMDAVLDTNIENQWLKYAPLYLMGEAGMLLSSGLRDKAATDTFMRWRNEGARLLEIDNEARKHTNTSPQMGGAH